jgi:hypothetical protein
MTQIRDAAEVWCPEGSYPRRVTRHQESKPTLNTLVNSVASRAHSNGFVSVYGFPEGHSSDGNIPEVDTLMLDFDIPGDQYYGDGSFEDWAAEMSELLSRVRLVVEHFLDEGKANHWRFSLSGHKGVHMYLDFPKIERVHGNLREFKSGLGAFVSGLIEYMEEAIEVELKPWLDVDSSDMGRLTRLPNTKHAKASKAFGSSKFCVPVTAKELQNLTVTDYWALTSSRRDVSQKVVRDESERAYLAIVKQIQESTGKREVDYDSTYNVKKIEEYKNNSKDGYKSLEDLWLFLEKRPCIKAYYDRDGDQFNYGNSSHVMELFVIAKLINMKVPYSLIVEFFATMGASNFNEAETKKRINELIARDYNEFNCERIWQSAERFCLESQCKIYNKRDE